MMLVQASRDNLLGWRPLPYCIWPYTDQAARKLAFHLVIACFVVLTTSCTSADVQDAPTSPRQAESALTVGSDGSSSEQIPTTTVPQLNPSNTTDRKASTTAGQGHKEAESMSEEVRESLVEAIARDLSQPEAEVNIESVTPQTWPDGCLGLATADEFCTMALVDGWQVNVQSGDMSAIYRSNASGTLVRRAN